MGKFFKRNSLVTRIILFNLAAVVAMVTAFSLLYGYFNDRNLRAYTQQRIDGYLTNTSETIDMLTENYINVLSRISYDGTVQASLGATRDLAAAKLNVRDVIDSNVSLNSAFLATAILDTRTGEIFQSSLEVLYREDILRLTDGAGEAVCLFAGDAVNDNVYYIVQKIFCDATASPSYSDLAGYVVAKMDGEPILTLLSPEYISQGSSASLLFRGVPVLKTRPAEGGESSLAFRDFALRLTVPGGELTSTPFSSPLGSITVLLLVGFVVVATSVCFNYIITKPVRLLSSYCGEIPFRRKSIPADFNCGSELVEVAQKINEMIANLNELSAQEADARQKVYDMTIEKQQLSLDMLYSQINSHFLYNTLSNIRGMALKKGNIQVADALHLLVRYFRYCASLTPFATVGQELDALDIYLKIQQIRYGEENLRYRLICPEELKGLPMLRMLLQPLAENSILHGFRDRRERNSIDITIGGDTESLAIAVEDNGRGMDAETRERINADSDLPGVRAISPDKSLGLSNIKKRLKLYYGDFGFRAESRPERTVFTITLPIKGEACLRQS